MSPVLAVLLATRCPQCGHLWDTMTLEAAWVHYRNRHGNCNSHEQDIYRRWRVRTAAARALS